MQWGVEEFIRAYMTTYFAYGSNLDQSQMKTRCPDHRFLGKAVLNDYKLDFTIYSSKRQCGCADIVHAPEHQVWGMLYKLTEQDLNNLDRFEGHPTAYKRITVKVVNEQGKPIEAETYEVANKSKDFQMPSQAYMQQIVSGAKTFNLPQDYVNMLTAIPTAK